MKLYVVLIDGPAVDTDVFVVSNPDTAVTFAREWAQQNSPTGGGVREHDAPGYLYVATYNPEGDTVSVTMRELDNIEPVMILPNTDEVRGYGGRPDDQHQV